MRPGRKPLVRSAALWLAVLFFAAAASARELTIRSFNEQVTVNRDGSLDVTEVIDARFTGHWNGIYRTIPVDYTGPSGFNYSLFLEPISITDDAGRALDYKQTRQGDSVKFQISVPGAEDATRTVVIRYRVQEAVGFFDDHDELYWNITGNQWDVPIESASAHIDLPAGVTGLHAIAYTGAFRSRAQDAQVDVSGDHVDIRADGELQFHEGLTAVVGFDKGLIQPPSPLAKAWLFLRSNWPLFLPILAFFGMFSLWWTRGRDPRRNAIAVQYEPPDKLTPGECGTLVDNQCDMRDITATLVDLAVKGYLTIEQRPQEGLLHLVHHNDYIFHLKKPPAEWSGLRPHEMAMLSGMFSTGSPDLTVFGSGQMGGTQALEAMVSAIAARGGAIAGGESSGAVPPAVAGAGVSVSLSEMQNHFYIHLPGIRSAIIDALVSDGYYTRSPDSVRAGYMGLGGILGFLLLFGSSALARATDTAAVAWVIAGVAVAAIVCVFGWYMPAHTVTGVRTLERILGFEDFLGRVEGDKIERIEKTPELFEKFLPYAMALRVDKRWAQAFSSIAMQPPQWYQGTYGSGFMPYLLVNDLNMMSMQAGTAMASAPRSSGSLGGSGFGGGGGAGGGFGGGGGGGW